MDGQVECNDCSKEGISYRLEVVLLRAIQKSCRNLRMWHKIVFNILHLEGNY